MVGGASSGRGRVNGLGRERTALAQFDDRRLQEVWGIHSDHMLVLRVHEMGSPRLSARAVQRIDHCRASGTELFRELVLARIVRVCSSDARRVLLGARDETALGRVDDA
jgi:hypothetical protein